MPPEALLHCARNAAVAGVRGRCANGSYRPGHSPPCSFHCTGDAVAESYAMVMLTDNGFAQQTELARAFGRTERIIRRHQERYAAGRMVGLGRPEG